MADASNLKHASSEATMLTHSARGQANQVAASPPGPRGYPLLGHLPYLARDPLGFFTSCAQEYGDIVSLRLGSWPTLLLNHPADLEYVFVKNHRNFVKNRFFWRHVQAIFGQGLLTSEGDFWHQQRRLAAPAFASTKVGGYAETMIELTNRMLGGWRDGDIRDIHAEMMMLTLRIAAKTLFSAEVEEDVVEIDHAVNDMTLEIASRFSRPFHIPDAVPLPGHLRYRRGLRRVERVVERIIASRKSSRENHGDVLSMLMLARDESGRGMSDRQLRDEVITMLLAGHETTALALSWTCHLLSQHPNADVHVYAELRQKLEGRQTTLADIPHLPVLENTFTESMRLFPPAWTIGREAVDACEIGGYRVPAGTTIFMSPWVIHRDPRFFERPETFRPERWTPQFLRALPRFAYLPFGGGQRICIGKSFAMQEGMVILSMILHRFRFTSRKGNKITPLPSITLRPKGGVLVKLVARH
jgi:cytochrome P450